MMNMEALYNKGFLSYPRTETTKYSKMINLRKIVEELKSNKDFGSYAARVASGELWAGPRDGKLDDKSHPPIHPVRNADPDQLDHFQNKVFDILSRHFLASISKDALGSETQAYLEIGNELFSASGLLVDEKNWLDVFPFDSWQDA